MRHINGSLVLFDLILEMFVNATNPFQFQYFNISIDQGHILQQEASHDISIPRNT